MRGLSLPVCLLPMTALLLAPLSVRAQSFTCSSQVPEIAAVRSKGLAEWVAPVVIRCTGTKPAGGIVGSIQVNLNVPTASRALGSSGTATEALLLVDNPAPGAQVGRSADSIVPNANVIQGFTNQGQTIWQTLEIAPAGPAGPFTREFRIVNIRANVSQLPLLAPVTMNITMLTNPFVPLTGTQVNVGTVVGTAGISARRVDDILDYSAVIDGCVGNKSTVDEFTLRDFNIRFSEGGSGEFRRRNVATTATASSALANQNDPLTNYGTETGFYNNTLTATNAMSQAGLATNGSRLMARFTGVPSGVSLYVTVLPVPEGTSAPSIVARLTAADTNGAGQFSPVAPAVGGYAQIPVVNGVASAVWEVLESDIQSLEYVSFGVVVSVPASTPTFGKISLQGGIGPIVPANPAGAPFTAPLFSSLPVGREVVEIRTCATLLSVATPCPLNPASVGQEYKLVVAAKGGTQPYGWSLAAGALPQGIQLTNNGFMAGVPQVSGTFDFTFRVTDFLGVTITKDCSLTVTSALSITSACPLPDAAVSVPYSQLLTSSGGQPGYLWLVSQGSLPPGVSLSPNGILNGTPTVAGSYDFTLKLQDALLYTTEKSCQLRVNGPFRLSPSELTFSGRAGGGAPASQMLSVSSSTAAQSFSVRVTTDNNEPWLRATPSTGTLPAAIEVTADPRSLAAGTYSGLVTVSTLNLAQQSLVARVTLQVSAGGAPQLSVEPTGVVASTPRGSGAVKRSVQVVNAGTGSLNYSAAVSELNGAGWITASPASGTATPEAPGVVRLAMNTATLDPGVYRARLTLTSAATNETKVVPITLAVSSGRDLMEISQAGLTFTAVNGGALPPQQELTIQSSGAGGFSWDATVVGDAAGASWLALTQSAGSVTSGSPSTVGVRVNASGLAAGVYFAEIRFRASGIENTPKTVLVALRVLPAATNPGLLLVPGGVTFTARQGETNIPLQTIQLHNLLPAATPFDYSFPSENRIFTAAAPDGRTATSGAPVRIQVTANVAGLGAGIYRYPLMIQGAADPRVQSVDVTLVVLPNATAAAAQEPVETRANFTCTTGSGIAVVARTPGTGFAALSGLAVPLDVTITERTGQPLRAGSVTMVPSVEGAATVSLRHAGNGRWTGTWTPYLPAGGPVTLSYFAEDADRGVSGCAQTSGLIEANTVTPYLPENGVVSTASFQAYEPVAHGSLMAIFGSKLAGAPAQAGSLPLPLQLGGTRASLGGIDMPLFYAGESGGTSQVNAQAPYNLAGGVTLPLVVRTAAGAAMTEVVVAEAQPGIFTTTVDGRGQGIVVLGTRLLVIADAANPAARGEVVVIYCAGLGRTQPSVNAGAAAPSNPPAVASAAVSVTIGGKPAAVQFAGLTPGLTGLYQINVVVPADADTGNAVPVVVKAGEASSVAVTMAVR